LKISLNWIKEFVDISEIPINEIIEKLTLAGLEVESYEDQNEIYKNFVVGYVKKKTKHPNADKLSLCKVSVGAEEFQVICGAPNVESGQKVVLALNGAIIPRSGQKLEKAKIRGIESNGMICSEAELNISDDHSGIMVLDNKLKEGTNISEALQLNDVILEIGITPNRPDALSHIGIARDLSALFNKKFSLPKIEIKSSKEKINNYAAVEIVDTKNCPRYSAKVVLNVQIQESPKWLKERLTSVGLRPINNIVDITNYVLYELGQPLHAFDLDFLSGNKIIVKTAEENSTFITLDSKERKLNKDVLMICDSEKPIAIAGIMGGENSEVKNSTKNILIESAYFNPASIRKSSKFLGHSTEASYRFERGTDPNITAFAAERTAELISDICGGKVCDGLIDIYPNKIENRKIFLRYSRTNKILGYIINKQDIEKILENLQFEIEEVNEEKLLIEVPTFRPDIEREIDLIEEIARIYGYEKIPTEPKIIFTLGNRVDESHFVNKIRDELIALGFNEMICNTLQNKKLSELTGNPIPLLNPDNEDMAYLRTSLIPGALDIIKKNIYVGEKNLMLFEIGKVFQLNNNEIKYFDDFKEEEKLIVLLTGRANEKEWYKQERYFDFFDLKGYIYSLFKKIGIENQLNDSYNTSENKLFNLFDYNIQKTYKNEVIGFGGKIRKEILNIFDIQQEVFCYEFSINKLKIIKPKEKRFTELLKYPKISKDFAFIFDVNISYKEIEKFIREKASPLLKNIKLFDIFESDSLGKNNRSMAINLEYYDEKRTLKDEEVEKDFNYLIEEIKKHFNAILRGI